jgi:hypothetical protein
MKIVVCGDSFMSADVHRPGTHFSELLTRYGHAVINLARGGISNTGIAFQIETAIKLNPDAVVFASTSHDRIDLLVKNRKFLPEAGLKNFIYPYKSDASTGTEHVGNTNAAIWSDVVIAFQFNRPDLPAELKNCYSSKSIKEYIGAFHDVQFKTVLDSWIIGYWEYKLKEHAIPFIRLSPNGIGKQMYDYAKNNPDKISQCVYHTDDYTQKEVIEQVKIELSKLGIQ